MTSTDHKKALISMETQWTTKTQVLKLNKQHLETWCLQDKVPTFNINVQIIVE